MASLRFMSARVLKVNRVKVIKNMKSGFSGAD
jgi:hypothetical protein